jgi:hypothetical protein
MRSQKNSDEWLAIRAKLISVCRINADSITQSERGKLHSATSELREVKATPAQIDMFVSWWQRTYPNAQITAKAISAHWSESEPEGGGMIFTAVEMGNMSTRTFFVGDRKYWYRETSKFGFKTNINYWKDTDEDWTTEDYERDGCSGRTNPYRLYEMMGGDEVDESVVVPIQNALGAFNRRRDSSEIVEEVAF